MSAFCWLDEAVWKQNVKEHSSRDVNPDILGKRFGAVVFAFDGWSPDDDSFAPPDCNWNLPEPRKNPHIGVRWELNADLDRF
jgi:hypothetical protein